MINRRFFINSGLLSLASPIFSQNSDNPEWLPYNLPAKFKGYADIDTDKGNISWQKMIANHNILCNFWAIWCAPCLKELPILNQLQQNPPVDNFRIITINIDQSAQLADNYVKKTLQLNNLTNYGQGMKLFQNFGFSALPTSLFINKSGKITGVALGDKDWLGNKWRGIFQNLYKA